MSNPRMSPSTAADLIEHTAELGGTSAIGGVSAFGLNAAGDLFIVNYSGGTILKVVGTTSVPTALTNLRIVR
jgi:hypothetical protein